MTSEDIARLEGTWPRWRTTPRRRTTGAGTSRTSDFHRTLTEHAGERVNFVLGQMFDHAERYRRLHIGHGPSAWATPGHRDILDACKAGDRDRSAALLAGHLARTGLEVSELLDPGYDPEALRTALVDAGGRLPTRDPGRRGKRARQGT